MEKVFIVLLIMVLSEANVHQRSKPYLFKSETSNHHLREENNLWSHAFEDVGIDVFKTLGDKSVDNVSNTKENIRIVTQTEKKRTDVTINNNNLRTLMKTTDQDITVPSRGTEFSMEPTEPIVPHRTALIPNTDIPFLTDKKKIWGIHSPGLDSGMLGIGAIDMGHGLRQFGL